MCDKMPMAVPPDGLIGPRVNFLSKRIRKAFNKAASEEGLFSGQQDLLLFLVMNEGATLSELTAELNVSAATVSVSVKRMEKAGFLIKKTDETDGRITRIYPTEKAKKTPENIRKKMDVLEEKLKKGMSEEEVQTLCDLLGKAIMNMLEEEIANG